MTHAYRARLESLLAVDRAVARIIGALEEHGELGRTVVVFTSDNGFMHGEHRIVHGKGQPYEPSIHVPLLMRGPDIPKGVTRRGMAANIDLAPTIFDLAEAEPLREPVDRRGALLALAWRWLTPLRLLRPLLAPWPAGDRADVHSVRAPP